MIESSKHPSKYEGRSIALIATVALHLAVLVISGFMHLREPSRVDITVQLDFRRTPPVETPVQHDQQIAKLETAAFKQTAAASRIPIRSRQVPPQYTPLAPSTVEHIQTVIAADNDSLRHPRTMTLRRVLDRELTPEQAWNLLATLIDEHPEFSQSLLREMIAGQGFVPDSLPPVKLYLEQILKNGIQPTWESQRGAIEEAFKSFDPVQGWTNKGGYGPQLNVIGLINFLLKLIEGK